MSPHDAADSGAIPGSSHDAIARATAAVAPIPRGEDGAPVFREPWEAQAFALAVALHSRGVFTWTEWARALSDEIRRGEAAGDGADGSAYYRHWLAAIERLVSHKGVTTPQALADRRDAWDRAAHATPHGEPIVLENDPLSRR